MTKIKNKLVIKFKALFVLFGCLLLSSCSFSFVYNKADWWVNWYLDDYVTFDKYQQAVFDKTFEKLHVWHRQTQLPLYQMQLKIFQAQVNKGLTENDLNEHYFQIRDHLLIFRQEIAPELLQLSLLLTDEQKNSFIAAVNEKNDELSDEINEESNSQWYRDVCKSRQSQFQKWIGNLSSEQKTIICDYSDQMQRTSNQWLKYRNDWLNGFSLVLIPKEHNGINGDNIDNRFADLIINPEQYMSESYNESLIHNRLLNQALFLNILNNLSKAQLNTFNNRMDDFIDDLNDLYQND